MKPTRVTSDSSTIIDHIITNDIQHNLHPAVIEENLTDHYSVVCVINQSKTNQIQNKNSTNFFIGTNLILMMMHFVKN